MAFFVALRHPQGYPTLVIDGDSSDDSADVPKLWETEAAADAAMADLPAAQAWGYEVYEWTE